MYRRRKWLKKRQITRLFFNFIKKKKHYFLFFVFLCRRIFSPVKRLAATLINTFPYSSKKLWWKFILLFSIRAINLAHKIIVKTEHSIEQRIPIVVWKNVTLASFVVLLNFGPKKRTKIVVCVRLICSFYLLLGPRSLSGKHQGPSFYLVCLKD